jgi:hypothetical protein
MPAIASELFGLAHFGAIMMWQSVANPAGSYILSVCVAGYLYDKEADKEHGHVPQPTGHPDLQEMGFLLSGGSVNGTGIWGADQGWLRLGRQVLGLGDQVKSLGGELFGSGQSGSWLKRLWEGSAGGAMTSKTCTGAHCFRLAFIIMAGVCAFGVLLNVWLTIRTREYYRGVWKEHAEKLASRESDKGSNAGDAGGASDEDRT